MRKAIEYILAVLGCAIVALVVGLVLSGLSASGVVSMKITHALFWLAFIISIVAVPLATWLISPSWKNVLASVLAAIVIVGGGLWWLDAWLLVAKAEQDAASKPLINTVAPSPSVPIAKTPIPHPQRPANNQTKPSQDNSVHIGAGARVDQNSTGPCSPNIIGGNTTINCGPPPSREWKISSIQRVALCSAPGLFTIVAVNSPEAIKLSNKIGHLLLDLNCGWKLENIGICSYAGMFDGVWISGDVANPSASNLLTAMRGAFPAKRNEEKRELQNGFSSYRRWRKWRNRSG